MTETRTVSNMSLVGGHAVLDFINTVDSRKDRFGPDYLQTYDDLLTFARRIDIVDPVSAENASELARQQPEAAAAALDGAKALREALYQIARSEFSGEACPPEAVDILDRAVQDGGARRHLRTGAEGLAWEFAGNTGLDVVADRIAFAALDLFIDGKDSRRPIRDCPGRNCGWVFLDGSRGGKRRWCSDRTCGTSTRVRKFRAA